MKLKSLGMVLKYTDDVKENRNENVIGWKGGNERDNSKTIELDSPGSFTNCYLYSSGKWTMVI